MAVALLEAFAAAGSWQDGSMERGTHWSRFAGRTFRPCMGLTMEISVPEGLHSMKDTHAGTVFEELKPV